MNIDYANKELFLREMKSRRETQLTRQRDFLASVRNGKYRGGFIIPQDEDFQDALVCYEWDCVSEYHDKARAIIYLPEPDYGAVVLYRLSADNYCMKALTGYTMEKVFPSWDNMKNLCISWGLLIPPVGDITGNSFEDFTERLHMLDIAMRMESLPDFERKVLENTDGSE